MQVFPNKCVPGTHDKQLEGSSGVTQEAQFDVQFLHVLSVALPYFPDEH